MEKLNIKDYPDKQYIEIEGIKYTYGLFKGLSNGIAIGEPFKIIERKDGLLTIERLIQNTVIFPKKE